MGFLQLLINGLLLGGVYALIGLGMTLVFGIVGLTNLAHGELVILGAYASTLLASALGVDPILTLAVTLPCMYALGYALQTLLINRAMEKGNEAALLVTFGLSIILQDGMLLLLSADARHAATAYGTTTLRAGGLNIPLLNLVMFGISLVFVAGLAFFLNRSYTGRAIRAVSDDRDTARLSGINVRKIYAVAMGVATAGAAAAGLCVGMKWTFYPSSGGQYLLTAFLVTVIGGMGSIPGTLLAGLSFGLAQVIGGANYGLLISYGVMLLVLAVRPAATSWQ
ncbi:MAG: branched-chain amino acid ABC transporter permease [Oscillospiraceae bacterium]|nr:branched-chain amino acid ABC transporter permease [Oscillospiraceae bacterium]